MIGVLAVAALLFFHFAACVRIQLDAPEDFEELTPESTGVACERLPTWFRKKLTSETPQNVQDLITRWDLSREYTDLEKEVFKASNVHGNRRSGWNITRIYRIIMDEELQKTFMEKNVGVVLRYDKKLLKTDLAICFIDYTVHSEGDRLNKAYRDAKTPLGGMLPVGVVAVPLESIRSDDAKTTLTFSGPDSFDLTLFLEHKALTETHTDLKKLTQGNYEVSARQLLLKFLEYQREKQADFAAKGVSIYACYARKRAFPKKLSLNSTWRYFLWFEYVDLAVQPDYQPKQRILKGKECESLQVPRSLTFAKTSLEVMAIMIRHGLERKYKDMTHDLLNLPSTSEAWNMTAVYRTMWEFEGQFNDRGVGLYLRQVPARFGFSKEICYVDSSRAGNWVPSYRFQDAQQIPSVAKQLPSGVVGEPLVEVHQRFVLKVDTPVDLMRLLRNHKALDLHATLVQRVREMPPSKNGVPAYIVASVAEELESEFQAKGVKVFVCSKVDSFKHRGFTGYQFLAWIEYVDLELAEEADYSPEEVVRVAAVHNNRTASKQTYALAGPHNGAQPGSQPLARILLLLILVWPLAGLGA